MKNARGAPERAVKLSPMPFFLALIALFSSQAGADFRVSGCRDLVSQLHGKHAMGEVPVDELNKMMRGLRTVASTTAAGLEPSLHQYVTEEFGEGSTLKLAKPRTVPMSPSIVYLVQKEGVDIAA